MGGIAGGSGEEVLLEGAEAGQVVGGGEDAHVGQGGFHAARDRLVAGAAEQRIEPDEAAAARLEELERGRAACLVRTLREPARSLLVLQDGTTEGSVGDAALDQAALRLAVQLFPAGHPVTQPIAGEGTEAFFELHAPRPHLVVVGGGHMSMPLVSLARAVGFRTTVVDPRPRFATRERFPDADELRVGNPAEVVAALSLVPSTAVVLTIHDPEVEVPVLRAVLASEAGYVGMLGSRKRGRSVLETLRQQGVPPEQLSRIQVPVGLDIGAQTAAEIALSVVAQVVATRTRRTGAALAGTAP